MSKYLKYAFLFFFSLYYTNLSAQSLTEDIAKTLQKEKDASNGVTNNDLRNEPHPDDSPQIARMKKLAKISAKKRAAIVAKNEELKKIDEQKQALIDEARNKISGTVKYQDFSEYNNNEFVEENNQKINTDSFEDDNHKTTKNKFKLHVDSNLIVITLMIIIIFLLLKQIKKKKIN